MSELDRWADGEADYSGMVRDYEAGAVREMANLLAFARVRELREECAAELAAAREQCADAEARLPKLAAAQEAAEAAYKRASDRYEMMISRGDPDKRNHKTEQEASVSSGLPTAAQALGAAQEERKRAWRASMLAKEAIKRLENAQARLAHIGRPQTPLMAELGILREPEPEPTKRKRR